MVFCYLSATRSLRRPTAVSRSSFFFFFLLIQMLTGCISGCLVRGQGWCFWNKRPRQLTNCLLTCISATSHAEYVDTCLVCFYYITLAHLIWSLAKYEWFNCGRDNMLNYSPKTVQAGRAPSNYLWLHFVQLQQQQLAATEPREYELNKKIGFELLITINWTNLTRRIFVCASFCQTFYRRDNRRVAQKKNNWI